jgi:hypothetical protein
MTKAGDTESMEVLPFRALQLATVGRGRPPISKADIASLNNRIAGRLNQERT